MNNPVEPLESELRRIAGLGFDLVDLTLEPPGAWPADGNAVAAMLDALGLAAVGHTAWYLPIASPFPTLREAALATIEGQLATFAAAGVRLVNVHPDPSVRLDDRASVVARNADAVARLSASASAHGLELMVENLGRAFGGVEELRPLLDAAPAARLHLDVGHANIGLAPGAPNRALALLEAFGDRLAHVHLHDNSGAGDHHLPLGSGTVDWPSVVAALSGRYDGTFTFEVFTPHAAHVETSRRLWLEWWSAASPAPAGS